MKLETFFEKFDQFADAPDAVGKMRELILLLALDGKIGDTDAATWERVQLGDLGEWGSGGTPLSTESRYYDGNIPWLIIGDLNDGVVTSSMKTITEEGLANSSARMLPKNVLLIAMYGSIGKLGITGIECATNQAIAFCKPDPGRADLRYLFHAFMGLRPKFLSRGQGLAQKNISQRILRAWEINLPPLAEQKRIVAKVDELMALCDRLEAQQQERETRHAALARASLARFADAPTPANLPFLFHPSYAIRPADLRKSILTLAVQGKLVPQDPNDEPAEELLQRVDTERERLVKSKKIRRQDFLGPVADDAIAFDIPASWQWRYLADVCFLITDGAHHTPQYLESGVPFLSVKDVSGGSIDFSSTRFISEEAHRELCKRCPPKRGDILLTKVGTTGIAVTIDEDREFSIFVSLALLKFSQPNLDGRYLKHLINSPFVKQQSADNTQGIGNKNLVLRLINRFTVPIPPLAEQRRIVAKVEQLIALVDALETQLAASRATAANLLSALVAELTGTPNNGKVSVPSASTTGRRGRPPKS